MKKVLTDLIDEGARLYALLLPPSPTSTRPYFTHGLYPRKIFETEKGNLWIMWLLKVRKYAGQKKLYLPVAFFDQNTITDFYESNIDTPKGLKTIGVKIIEQIDFLEPKTTVTQFTFSKEGVLREEKSGKECQFRRAALPARLLRQLARKTGNNFRQTRLLAADLNILPPKYSKNVAVIKKRVQDRFKIKGKDFIEGSQGSGYRLADNIRVKIL